ncbi:hypothetical protein ACH3XW_25785 [Acanthocheilonema viteae]|uniref:Uncharacterized protein n=1 Tax=Acanthocheilonema viteae TaxID=6277 RepID=A0A498SDL2_ACAVI|nr:unnamed protein product [Acanthocheilonema viteae]
MPDNVTATTTISVAAITTASSSITDNRIAEFLSRRRGIGKTLPVGWKPLLPPTDAVRQKILDQIMTRRKEEERDRAERAARAEERKNEEEKHAWYKEEIGECEKKIQCLNARKTELDEAKSKLFAELKEVVAKSKDRTQNQATFYSQLIQSQTRNKDRNTDVVSVPMRQFSTDGLHSGTAITSAYSDLQMSILK